MITRPLAFATGVVGLATLLAFGGRWSWICELLVNFRTQYALLLGLALIIAALTRHWRIAGVAALGLALNLWPMQGVIFGARTTPPADSRTVRLVAFNVHLGNADMPRVARYLESLKPDVVVLEELPVARAQQLFELTPSLPHRVHLTGISVGGIAILSRLPLIEPQLVSRDDMTLAVRAEVDLGDRRLRLYGIHLYWPMVAKSAEYRNAQLRALGRELGQCQGACVAAGDFNTTPWSSHFRDLLATSGFADCARGQGWAPSWPAQLPGLLRIRIDQCLASPAVSAVGVRIGEGAGSDHLATINDLSVGGAPHGKTPP